MVVVGFGGSVGTGGFVVGGSGKKTRSLAFATHVKHHNLPSSSIMVTTATPGDNTLYCWSIYDRQDHFKLLIIFV